MRIAYIGNFEPPYSTENDVRKAFEHLGHEVIQLQENGASTLDRLQYALVRNEHPFDLLLITSTWDEALDLKGMLHIFKLCADRGIPTATYHLDVFWGSDRGDRRWWLNPMFRVGYVFTASNDYQTQWRNMGVNHTWLRPAVRHDAVHLGTFREEYACDVAFVGSNGTGYHENAWPYRKQLIDYCRDMCARNGWKWRNPGGEPEKPNWGKVERNEERNDFYASAKVTIGDSLCLLKADSQYCSDRAYEAPGCGGFLIMPELKFLDEDFGGNMPMYPWGDFERLENMVRDYLADDVGRQALRQVNLKTVERDHTYVNRVKTILERAGL